MSFSLAAHTFGSAFPQRNFPPGGSVPPQCRRRSRLSQPPLEFWVRARDPAFSSQVCGHRAWSYKPVMKEAGFRERTLGRVVVCTFLQGSSGEGSSLLWAAGCFYRYFWWSCSVVRSGEHFGLVLWPVWGHPGLPFREFLSRSTQPEYLNLTCHQESCPLLWVIPVLEPVRMNVKYHL